MAEMTAIDWAKRPLQKYADFKGRAPRAEYWWYVLALVIAGFVLGFVEGILGLNQTVAGFYGPLTLLLWLATIVPSIAVSIRRLHDTNRSGWWFLLPVVPYGLAFILGGASLTGGSMTGLGAAGILLFIGLICAIVLLIFSILPGTRGPNSYGPDPYAEDVEKVFA